MNTLDRNQFVRVRDTIRVERPRSRIQNSLFVRDPRWRVDVQVSLQGASQCIRKGLKESIGIKVPDVTLKLWCRMKKL